MRVCHSGKSRIFCRADILPFPEGKIRFSRKQQYAKTTLFNLMIILFYKPNNDSGNP